MEMLSPCIAVGILRGERCFCAQKPEVLKRLEYDLRFIGIDTDREIRRGALELHGGKILPRQTSHWTLPVCVGRVPPRRFGFGFGEPQASSRREQAQFSSLQPSRSFGLAWRRNRSESADGRSPLLLRGATGSTTGNHRLGSRLQLRQRIRESRTTRKRCCRNESTGLVWNLPPKRWVRSWREDTTRGLVLI